MADVRLDGKVALVTGAGSPIGMGRVIALAMLRAGARVAMLDIKDDWLQQTANEGPRDRGRRRGLHARSGYEQMG